MKEISKAFKNCDANGDKKVTGAELSKCLGDAAK